MSSFLGQVVQFFNKVDAYVNSPSGAMLNDIVARNSTQTTLNTLTSSIEARPIFNIESHVLGWMVGGIFAFLAILIALVEMIQHCKYNPDPMMRRYVLRIIFMVPLYAIQSWMGLLMREYTEYWDLAREAYEAVVIYSFYMVCRSIK